MKLLVSRALPQYNAAPDVTRERIYLDTLEKVYSNTSKIVVDRQVVETVYLPLDKILQQQSKSNQNNSQNTVEALRQGLTEVGKDLRSGVTSSSRDRSRGGRN